jgi:hypothetical protein
MVDRRGKGYPAQRDRDYWCYPGFLGELDANLATQPLCFVIPASFHFLFSLQLQGVMLRSALVSLAIISLPYIEYCSS